MRKAEDAVQFSAVELTHFIEADEGTGIARKATLGKKGERGIITT